MSNDVSPDAWKTKLGNAAAKSVLVLLADAANPAGFGYPSIPHMCDRTELSERQVLRVIQVFQEIGLIVKGPGGMGPRGPYRYSFQISMEMLCKDLRAEYRVAFLRAQGKLGNAVQGVSETVNQPVSETPETVSETEKGVSETVPPHPLFGGTVREPSRNQSPLPPAAGGREVFTIHPLLLNDAVDGVMKACGWTDRRIKHAICAQLKLASMQGEALPLAAARMVTAWGELLDAAAAGLLRVAPYGPKKFIGLGKWNDSDSWPWDMQKLEMRRNARVGMR